MGVRDRLFRLLQRHLGRHDARGPGRCRGRSPRDPGRPSPAWACPCELTLRDGPPRRLPRHAMRRSTRPHEHAHRHLHHIEAMIDKSTPDPPAERAGQADLPPAGRGRGGGPRHRHPEDPLPRGRRGRFDRRHRRRGGRARPAGRRPVRGQPGPARPGLGQGGARPDAPARSRRRPSCSRGCRWPSRPSRWS